MREGDLFPPGHRSPCSSPFLIPYTFTHSRYPGWAHCRDSLGEESPISDYCSWLNDVGQVIEPPQASVSSSVKWELVVFTWQAWEISRSLNIRCSLMQGESLSSPHPSKIWLLELGSRTP
jgi:hypothetical protein